MEVYFSFLLQHRDFCSILNMAIGQHLHRTAEKYQMALDLRPDM